MRLGIWGVGFRDAGKGSIRLTSGFYEGFSWASLR